MADLGPALRGPSQRTMPLAGVCTARKRRRAMRAGVNLYPHVMDCCLARADDTWLFASSAQELNNMIRVLRQVAWGGNRTRVVLGKVHLGRNPPSRPADQFGGGHHLSLVRRVTPGECLKVLGAYVQLDGQYAEEFRQTLAAARVCDHSEAAPWRACGTGSTICFLGVVVRQTRLDSGRFAELAYAPGQGEMHMWVVAAGKRDKAGVRQASNSMAEALWAESGVPAWDCAIAAAPWATRRF